MRSWIAAFFVVVALSSSVCCAQGSFQVLGIFDEPEMLHDFGTMAGIAKSVWVGVQLGGPLDDGHTSFQFSISGLQVFDHFEMRFPSPPIVVVGSPAAPADTTTGTGGVGMAWAECQTPGIAFMELVLYSLSAPQNHVLRVHQRFPPNNPATPWPFGTHCDAPCFCEVFLNGASYVLNPTVGVEQHSWGAVKQLYGTTNGALVPGPVHR